MSLWPFFVKSPDPKPADPAENEWEKESEDESKGGWKEHHAHYVLAFRFLRQEAEHRVEQLTRLLGSGDLDSREWASAFRAELADVHTEAYVIGRRLAGHVGAFTAADRVAGEEAWARQDAEYFVGFIADIERGDPRYVNPDGSLNEKAVDRRAKQYVTSTRGTVHASFRLALGKELTHWNLGKGDHCKPSSRYPYNCPDLAAESPKPADEWQTEPAGMKTPCGGSCTCFLSTDSGHSTEGI